jgi:hypothetical protein
MQTMSSGAGDLRDPLLAPDGQAADLEAQRRSPTANLRAIVLAAVLATAATAAAAPSKPPPPPKSEVIAARHALLKGPDLRGWRSTPGPKKAPTLTCPAFAPNLGTLPTPGAAASPTFMQTANGPFVSQSAYVYPTAKQELTFWHRAVTRRLATCVAGALTSASTSSVTFTVKSKHSLPLPAIADRRAGYRVIGTAKTTAQEITVYLDMLVVGRGSGLTQISFTSFSQPVARALELRLARLVTGRLPADGSAPKA